MKHSHLGAARSRDSAEGAVYRILRPLVKLSKPLMRGFALLVESVFLPFVWLFRMIRGGKGGD